MVTWTLQMTKLSLKLVNFTVRTNQASNIYKLQTAVSLSFNHTILFGNFTYWRCRSLKIIIIETERIMCLYVNYKQGSSENDVTSDVCDRSELKVISNCCYTNCCRTNCNNFYFYWPEFTWIYLNLCEFTLINLNLPKFTLIYINLPEPT